MINHKGTNSIETTRLLLRRFEAGDASSMFDNWASDPLVCKFLSWGPHRDISVTRKRINDWLMNYEYDDTYNWAICIKSKNEALGSISVELFDDHEKYCEIGYCISREYWNYGLMTEALRAVMHYLFFDIGYEKIQAKHDVLNIASGRVMQKAGMKFEGILYHVSKRRDGSFCDVAVYSKKITEE